MFPTFSRHSFTRSVSGFWLPETFSLSGMENSAKSWNTTDSIRRYSPYSYSEISFPLTKMLPSVGSYSLHNSLINVVFPLPFFPTTAIFSCGLIVTLRCFNTKSLLSGYRNETSRNSILHGVCWSSFSKRSAVSSFSSRYEKYRSRYVLLFFSCCQLPTISITSRTHKTIYATDAATSPICTSWFKNATRI